MANDIAEVGIAYNSANLKKAKADLEALVPAAAKVEKATLAVARASEAQARAALAATRANAGATAAEIKNAEAAVRQAAAVTAGARANLAASGALETVGRASQAASGKLAQTGAASDAAASGITAAGNAAQNSASKMARLGAAANDNLNAVQATPANIAAQFQDIGVTAAAGMNPMLIALQQGTQLSVAFSNGIGGIGAALKQIFSPVALLTIGAVALVAALIQMVDWVSVGKAALYGLADVMEVAAPYAVALAAGLALINAPAILTGIVALTKGMWGLATGMLAAVGIPTLIVAGLVAIVAAANYFRDDLSKILGFDIVQSAKDGVNHIIGFFVGAYNGIAKLFSTGNFGKIFQDVMLAVVHFVLSGINTMINGAIDAINLLLDALPDWMKTGSGQIKKIDLVGTFTRATGVNPANNTISNEVAAAQKVDYVGAAVGAIEAGGKYLGGKLRGIADGLGKTDKKDKTTSAKSGGKTDAEKFSDILTDADRRIAALQAESRMIGLYGEALFTAKAKQDMLNDAMRQGLTLDKQQIAQIDEKAKKIGALTESNREKEFMQQLIEGAEERNRQLKTERGELGLTGAALLAYRYEQEMLNSALREHINLSDPQKEAIKETARLYGEQAEAIRKASEALEFDRNVTRGFFRDFLQGARDGEGAWRAFSNAFNNVMDKIIDKLLNDVLDAIFKVNSAAQGGGGGGLLGFLSSAVGLLGGSGLPTAAQSQSAALDSLSGSAVTMNAKGNAFTNSIVSRPTAFAFGRGGANLGIMGEAGNEAIMPLTRGPDGSLGVQMYGNDNGGSPGAQGPVTFDMRGAIVTEDLLAQVNQIASERADVAVVRERTRNTRIGQRSFTK